MKIKVSELRENIATVLDKVRVQKEQVKVYRYGKLIAEIKPVEDSK